VTFLWLAVLIVVMGGMWWVGYRMEPHWVSKDGERFMCGSQEFFHGSLAGHPREAHIAILPGGGMHITQKRRMRRQRSIWKLVGKSDDPPKGLEIYVAQQSIDGVTQPEMLALRIPKTSKCVAILDAELTKAGITVAPPKTP